MVAPFGTYRTAGLTFMAAALVAVHYVRLCLRDGVVLERLGKFERARRPGMYWLLITWYVGMAVGFLVMGIFLVLDPS